MSEINDDMFGADSEMQSQKVDWGVPGDFIIGTFMRARHKIKTDFGEKSLFEFLSDHGSFHRLVGKGRAAKPEEAPTTIGKGETWIVWGKGDIMTGQLNSLRPGQIVKVQYTEDKETSLGTAKIIKIFAPKEADGKVKMNQAWLDEQGVTGDDF